MASCRQELGTITRHFGELEDPRMDRTRRHELLDIMTIAICGVICGADSWVDFELFGKSKQDWLAKFLRLPNGIPSHDTFGRVFARLDPDKFQSCFMDWVAAISQITQGQVIAIDGKTVRGSHDRANGKAAIHMVSAWASANHLVLGQTKVDDKSNEITAIPELLEILELSGCIVTIDAMGCQTEIAQRIISKGADYVLALKENQGGLHEDVKDSFDYGHRSSFEDVEHDYYEVVNKGHGRIETRRCWSISDREQLDYIDDHKLWEGLRSVIKVSSQREVGDQVSVETRYYISSLRGSARKLLEATRTHWGIENRLHWVLDVAFDEDRSRVRKDHAPQNLAIIRHIALNLLKQETTSKGGVKARRKRAGWDEDYLITVLSQ
jgi:predicted transposase YbfD/YdcC|tara:strand:+ start:78 stop:1220 length:1143 start_codon:yes stop_codon:yes gene_type:complete